MNKDHVVMKVLESAKNGRFINNTFHGNVEVAGSGHKFISNTFINIKKEHPFGFWFFIVGSILIPFIIFFAGPIYNEFYLPNPSLEYLLGKNQNSLVFAIKNTGEVGVKNISVTRVSNMYQYSYNIGGFAGTNFDEKSKFNRAGENWMFYENLPPKSLPLEKEFAPSVSSNSSDTQLISVEMLDIFYQRESDLKQYHDYKIFLYDNGNIYSEEQARLVPKYSSILNNLPPLNDYSALRREVRGIQKL